MYIPTPSIFDFNSLSSMSILDNLRIWRYYSVRNLLVVLWVIIWHPQNLSVVLGNCLHWTLPRNPTRISDSTFSYAQQFQSRFPVVIPWSYLDFVIALLYFCGDPLVPTGASPWTLLSGIYPWPVRPSAGFLVTLNYFLRSGYWPLIEYSIVRGTIVMND